MEAFALIVLLDTRAFANRVTLARIAKTPFLDNKYIVYI